MCTKGNAIFIINPNPDVGNSYAYLPCHTSSFPSCSCFEYSSIAVFIESQTFSFSSAGLEASLSDAL